jgi:hypothetical protein
MDSEKEQNVLIDLGIPSEDSQTTTQPTSPSTTTTTTTKTTTDHDSEKKPQELDLSEKTQALDLNEKQPELDLEEEQSEPVQAQGSKEKERERAPSPTPPTPPPKDDKFLHQQYAQDDDLANIMAEMDDDVADPALQKIMSPRLDMSQLPTRTSSLDPSPSPSAMTSPKLQRPAARPYRFTPSRIVHLPTPTTFS